MNTKYHECERSVMEQPLDSDVPAVRAPRVLLLTSPMTYRMSYRRALRDKGFDVTIHPHGYAGVLAMLAPPGTGLLPPDLIIVETPPCETNPFGATEHPGSEFVFLRTRMYLGDNHPTIVLASVRSDQQAEFVGRFNLTAVLPTGPDGYDLCNAAMRALRLDADNTGAARGLRLVPRPRMSP